MDLWVNWTLELLYEWNWEGVGGKIGEVKGGGQ